ncbi:MAG TPA: hypothetical protein VMQ50_00165 [Casimicrobiaceae bacterium]|nr:hypothetical protein [Casimicrobiaceae bacterium]
MATALAVCLLWGCASAPPSEIKAAGDVKVYDGGNLPPNQYDVVRRIWVDSWRSAFWLPTYPSEGEAVAALKAEASRAGADGLVNVACVDEPRATGSTTTPTKVLCYANAIRLRQKAG